MPMSVSIEWNKALERKADTVLGIVPIESGQRWKVRTDSGD